MKKGKLLHPELAGALAAVGHSDIIMVTDAGFPIPRDVFRVDLAFYEGMVDLYDILMVLKNEMFFEEVLFAKDIIKCNTPLYNKLQDIFTGSGAVFKTTTHEVLVNETIYKSKVVIRSGSYNPWGNIALTSSTDPFAWFTDDSGTIILPKYTERREMIKNNTRPEA